MEGIADASGASLDAVVIANIIYELATYCTSLIFRTTNDTLVHVRNLDFAFPDKTRAITYKAQFYKQGVH